MNHILYAGIAGAARSTGAMALLEKRFAEDAIFIVMLHRVLPADEMQDCYNPHLALTPESLDAFLRFAAANGTVLGLRAAVEQLNGARSTRGPIFVLTFDDGWEDNHRHAFPILRKHNAPATIFLATDLIGSAADLPEARLWRAWRSAEQSGSLPRLLETLRAAGLPASDYSAGHQRLKTLPMAKKSAVLAAAEAAIERTAPQRAPFMTWEQVNEMAQAGIEFGSHTCSHAVLQYEPGDSVMHELNDSRRIIRERTGKPCELFAYPNGIFSAANAAAVRNAGYQAAVSTIPRAARRGDDRYALPRVSLDNAVVNGLGQQFSESCCRLHLLNAAWSRSAAAGSY